MNSKLSDETVELSADSDSAGTGVWVASDGSYTSLFGAVMPPLVQEVLGHIPSLCQL